MSVKDNRGKCDVCGGPTTATDRVKVVFPKTTGKHAGEEAFHNEAHRGRCAGMLFQILAQGETGEVND